jgi:hypothetical protein
MLLEARSLITLIRKSAILFLAFAVFGLGLHARLELYKSSSSFNPTSAKVSTEKQSAQTLKGLEGRREVQDFTDKLAFGIVLSSIRVEPICNSITQMVEIGLSSPTRFDLSGDFSLHLPPPSLT